ncbi:hypothetical protein [Rhodococcus sovatensis]|uniref:Uncharacterized protein n=1 Tax=Rhodococcus sovatensis TaxID=1805840 RepID=A0ABZ2PT49_9NOCA
MSTAVRASTAVGPEIPPAVAKRIAKAVESSRTAATRGNVRRRVAALRQLV